MIRPILHNQIAHYKSLSLPSFSLSPHRPYDIFLVFMYKNIENKCGSVRWKQIGTLEINTPGFAFLFYHLLEVSFSF